MDDETWIRPKAAAAMIPALTESNLAQMRHRGTGPAWVKTSNGLVLYKRTDVAEWAKERAR